MTNASASKTANIPELTKVFWGPSDITLRLDASQVFPDDPGQGTPALVQVYCGRRGNQARVVGTYWCAVDTGEVDAHTLSSTQTKWLGGKERFVDSWLTRVTDLMQKHGRERALELMKTNAQSVRVVS